MNPQRHFDELGVNAVIGAELMEKLGIFPHELSDHLRFHRLKAVIDYLKGFPDDTQRFLISKATAGKNVDRLDYMFEYIHLLKEKDLAETSLKKIEEERSALELSDEPMLKMSVAQRDVDTRQHLNRIKEEIQIYEK